ncbi:MAG: hypothetical protein JNJ73_03240 [Hyphomonadaceae bacterium]|nr:hypothetical protein [Hyphomonadaceae bacterium]
MSVEKSPGFASVAARDPAWLAQKLDPERQAILFIGMSRADYAAASFLDDRILTPAARGAWTRIASVRAGLEGAPSAPLHFIFHSGHVGSTLLSRVLESPKVLALREPLPLRTLAELHDAAVPDFAAHLETMLRLWRRPFPGVEAVTLKATSAAARIAAPVMRAAPDAKAIYLNMKAEPYLAVLLAGENTPIDLQGMQAERTRRLASKLGAPPPPPASLGELAALTWAAERLTQADLMREMGARVRALDFDAFLERPGEEARACAAHLGIPAPDVEASPILTRYSKAPDYAYSPRDRAAIIAQSRSGNAAEISRGLAWLAHLADAHPAIADAFDLR